MCIMSTSTISPAAESTTLFSFEDITLLPNSKAACNCYYFLVFFAFFLPGLIKGVPVSAFVLNSFSRARLFVTALACQVALSMGFSRQEYWSGLPFPSPVSGFKDPQV